MTTTSSTPSMYFGVLVLPNPDVDGVSTSDDIQVVPESISFRKEYDSAEVLYQASKDDGTDITGLLYVPDISGYHQDCGSDYLPKNVTAISSFPSTYYTVAIAPLTNETCAEIWMDQAHHDGAIDVIFYTPSNSNTSLGLSWIDDVSTTGTRTYSVYQISTSLGEYLIQKLTYYSGNMTGAPNGLELTENYDFRDYVRVAVEIDTPKTSGLPGLWVFLVIAFGVLVLSGIVISLGVHLLQYFARRSLRQRINRGEVNLEALGIKRLTVPKHILDTLPVRTYVPGEQHFISQQNASVNRLQMLSEAKSSITVSSIPKIPERALNVSETPTGYSQPTCPICLEDFIPNISLVRELPCMHIYHLHCIDTFLEHQSSLCPMCKQSTLPKGYFPSTIRITNATVRRERRLRNERTGFQGFIARIEAMFQGPFSTRRRHFNSSDSEGQNPNFGSPEQDDGARESENIELLEVSHDSQNNRNSPERRTVANESLTTIVPSADASPPRGHSTTVTFTEEEHESQLRKILHIMFPYLY
ncbi:hypothetical protein V1511DRAFT_496679 [Dipodascopsis uninucleata]